MTTAGTQQRFAYQKMCEVYADMVNGKSAFSIGNSYDLPCMHNQLDIDFIEELKESPTFSIMDFMREYESVWTGSSSESLVSDDKLNNARTNGIAEWRHSGEKNVEYVLSYDVARNEGADGRYIVYTNDFTVYTDSSLNSIHKVLINGSDIWLFGNSYFKLSSESFIRKLATGSIIR